MVNHEMFEKSLIIAAHPDDEILWFSSILQKVDKIIFCFLDVPSRPDWSAGRRQTLKEYPIKNMSYFEISESEVFNGANWQDPSITKYGLKISNAIKSDKQYKKNYYEQKRNLENVLAKYRNIFTHNPWGEYGNEEHVQLYRIVKELQKQMNFNLWVSNYCSNKSIHLMLGHISDFNSEYVTLKTNKTLAHQIKNLYEKNGCWTWYNDWKWFNEESFMNTTYFEKSSNDQPGHIFPLNMIKVIIPAKTKVKNQDTVLPIKLGGKYISSLMKKKLCYLNKMFNFRKSGFL